MSCKFSHLKINEMVTLIVSDGYCNQCGHEFSYSGKATYLSHQEMLGFYGDIFRLGQSVKCDKCGNETRFYGEPCEEGLVSLDTVFEELINSALDKAEEI